MPWWEGVDLRCGTAVARVGGGALPGSMLNDVLLPCLPWTVLVTLHRRGDCSPRIPQDGGYLRANDVHPPDECVAVVSTRRFTDLARRRPCQQRKQHPYPPKTH
jgi:hypothetical protein